jgi:hypothetical protein
MQKSKEKLPAKVAVLRMNKVLPMNGARKKQEKPVKKAVSQEEEGQKKMAHSCK